MIMIKRYCNFCGNEIGAQRDVFTVRERGNHHLINEVKFDLCSTCCADFLNRIDPGWEAKRAEHERVVAERRAAYERKKAEAQPERSRAGGDTVHGQGNV